MNTPRFLAEYRNYVQKKSVGTPYEQTATSCADKIYNYALIGLITVDEAMSDLTSLSKHIDHMNVGDDADETINGKTYSDLLESQDTAILNATMNGRRRCIFEIHDTIYDVWESKMKEHYRRNGFTFEPVGIIGGDRQKDEYICW